MNGNTENVTVQVASDGGKIVDICPFCSDFAYII
jgi:hypothetical protein